MNVLTSPSDIEALVTQAAERHRSGAGPLDHLEPPLPAGFERRPDGLWYQPPQQGDAIKPPVHVCGPFDIAGLARTPASAGWAPVVRWRDPDGVGHEAVLSPELLAGDGRELATLLRDGGFPLRSGGRRLLHTFLQDYDTQDRVRLAEQSGWQRAPDGTRLFILPDGTAIGEAAEPVIFVEADRRCLSSGTLEDWQQKVAAYCAGNSRLALFVSAAFAAPLLDPFEMPGGGFHLVGGSSSGKSTALFAAASVWGAPRPSDQVRSWNSTPNALGGMAAAANDLPIYLDELGEAAARNVGAIVYSLANGIERSRMTRTLQVRAAKTWRTIPLSTGEITPEQRMAEVKEIAKAGQEVRLANVPAGAGAGHGLFEALHGMQPGELADRLRENSRRSHGKAGRAWLERLVSELNSGDSDLEQRWHDMRADFEARMVPSGADGQVKSVAKRFALCAFAGEQAIAWQIVPWPAGAAMQAAERCFAAWLEARGSAGSGEDAKALAAIRGFIERHEARFQVMYVGGGMGEAPRERAGFKRTTEAGDTEWLILPEVWRKEVCAGLDPAAAAKALRDAGHLDAPLRGAHLSKKIRVPGMGQTRAYVVRPSVLEG